MEARWKNTALSVIILFNSATFILYGTVKLLGLQFVHREPAAGLLLKDVPPSYVMWYFFGLKKGYSILVGLSELLPGVLLLFKRTRLLGSLLYLFTLTNVLAVNVFFGVTSNTMSLSVILLVNALIILASEKQKITALLA